MENFKTVLNLKDKLDAHDMILTYFGNKYLGLFKFYTYFHYICQKNKKLLAREILTVLVARN
jgi:hypothetical protein